MLYTVLQWNMGVYHDRRLADESWQSRIDVLRTLVAERAPSLVTLQEAPADLQRLRVFGPRYQVIPGPRGVATAVLQPAWSVLDYSAGNGWRALVIKANPRRGKIGLWIVNVHLPILYKDSDDRRTFARCEPRDDLRRLRERDPDRCELLIGDFNLPPYDAAMTRRDGFYANSSPAWVSSKTRQRDAFYRPLYSPPVSVPELGNPPFGSYYRDKDKDGPGPWWTPDQVLMSARLATPGESQASLVTHAGTTTLCDPKRGRPNPKVGSDHLPLWVSFSA
ncbi:MULTISPECIES: endonuclease/exonuclease/phosphatase family protein [Sorangium]|uniref:endonuclease/exonuclease/phosphatase family protein n=1 Tax=Sorangium TaxID=39643 RepID=UPI003D9BFEC1